MPNTHIYDVGIKNDKILVLDTQWYQKITITSQWFCLDPKCFENKHAIKYSYHTCIKKNAKSSLYIPL